jgi:hypothetical protein
MHISQRTRTGQLKLKPIDSITTNAADSQADEAQATPEQPILLQSLQVGRVLAAVVLPGQHNPKCKNNSGTPIDGVVQ